MADRIRSDNDALQVVDAELEPHGATNRLVVRVPADADHALPEEGVVRLVLDGSEYRASVTRPLRGEDRLLTGAYDTADAARDPDTDHDDRLAAWVEDSGLDAGRTVHLDVVVDEFRYGLRAPGETATYDTSEPDRGLAAIADDVDATED